MRCNGSHKAILYSVRLMCPSHLRSPAKHVGAIGKSSSSFLPQAKKLVVTFYMYTRELTAVFQYIFYRTFKYSGALLTRHLYCFPDWYPRGPIILAQVRQRAGFTSWRGGGDSQVHGMSGCCTIDDEQCRCFSSLSSQQTTGPAGLVIVFAQRQYPPTIA